MWVVLKIVTFLLFLSFTCNSIAQESWKSLAGESDDEPSWDAKTAFKNTRNPIFALPAPIRPERPDLYGISLDNPPINQVTPITSFKQCQEGGSTQPWRGPRAWWHGWCFLEEHVNELQCTQYKYGRILYIADKQATNAITQLLEQWERDERELSDNNQSQGLTANDDIGQWYIEGMDSNGKCQVYDWKTKTTSYSECNEQKLRVLCQYPVCRDRMSESECKNLAKLGDCTNNRAWMEDNCQNTCVCNGKNEIQTKGEKSVTTNTPDCENMHELCNYWNWLGECEQNPVYMHRECKTACGLCDGKVTNQVTVTADSKCTNSHVWCEFWSWLGECEANPSYMRRKCKGACNPDCIGVNDPAFCVNELTDCELWSAHGECIKNRGFMMWKCKKSCHSACKTSKNVNYLQ